jgi:hypothetical protein
MHPSMRALSGALCVSLLISLPAQAQISRAGDPTRLIFTRDDVAIAYDPVHDVYAVVGTTDETVRAAFVDASALPVGSVRSFGESWSAHNVFFTWAPGVTYSPDVVNSDGTTGDFMLVFGQPTISSHLVTRAFRYSLSPPFSSAAGSGYYAGFTDAAIAYSSTDRVFLVATPGGYFQRAGEATAEAVPGILVGANAAQIGDWFPLAGSGGPAQVSGMRWDTAVEWDPNTNTFGVAYAWSTGSAGGATFVRVATNGSVLSRTSLHSASAAAAVDLAFNPSTGRYVAVWYDGAVRAAEISAAGDILATGVISSNVADALSLSYNSVSGTFLLAVHGPATALWAAELNGRGARSSGDIYLSHPSTSYREYSTFLGPAAFDVDIAATTRRAEWNVAFTNTTTDGERYSTNAGVDDFTLNTKIFTQIVRTTSTNGGASGSLTPVSTCATPDPFASLGGGTCVNGGWLPPGMAAPAPTPTGCAIPDPFASIPGMYGVCINGGWVPRLR